jgi:hypothetical protein
VDDVGTQPRNLLNAAKLATGLGVSSPTITSYLGLLAGLLLLRRLPPYLPNVRKRLVKSPKTYVRDSGLLHALLGIHSVDELLGHPVAGMSWAGFVLENLLAAAPDMSGLRFIEQRRVRRLTWCWNWADAPESGRSRLRRTRRPS